MAIGEELEAAAAAAAPYGTVSGVLAAETAAGGRAYLVALGEDEERAWLVLDALLDPVADPVAVREVASIVVLSELTVELAAGGQLDELRPRLEELAASEGSAELASAASAAAELEAAIGVPPRLSSPAFLDRVGAATRRLERELGEHGSPLASALAAHASTVESFVGEVEERYVVPLRPGASLG